MDREQMVQRTQMFAVRVVKLVAALPSGRVGDVLRRQLLKAGTSVGANYREALRASSRRHFITTLEIAEREADETLYWLDLITASGIVKQERLAPLRKECRELLAILTATTRTTKQCPARKNSKSEIRNSKSTITL